MDIEQAMRAMAPLGEDEERRALGLDDAPWPPPLTEADREAARAERFATWISEEEERVLFPRVVVWNTKASPVGDLRRRVAKNTKREDREAVGARRSGG